MGKSLCKQGIIVRIAGPVVGAINLQDVRLHNMVFVGEEDLVGEVIRLDGNITTIQVHEETTGLRIGETVRNTGLPMVVELGPGMAGRVYDGLQRPLTDLAEKHGGFLKRGVVGDPLSRDILWDFSPRVSKGNEVGPGCILGVIQESKLIEHRIMVPPGVFGRVAEIKSGKYKVTDFVVQLEKSDSELVDINLIQRWPVRRPRPIYCHLDPSEPLITGTRIIDMLFPIAKGGSAIIPGGFGTGKTATMQSLTRWSDVDIVVYVGCGERGNEMAMVLDEFPKLTDPRSGESLMNRTVLIANTSNMPVAAREASIYTGITIAEYYRDMGYDVLMLADSTSRWGEALREISGRLEEIPGEEGFPAYQSSRLSEFYERTGRVNCLSGFSSDQVSNRRVGSISLIGAVSPPGGDFSEPITQSSMRVAGAFWALDYDLSRRRHFPAINWMQSYTLYDFNKWYAKHVDQEWPELIRETIGLMSRENELLEIVRLVGRDAISEFEQEILVMARMVSEDLLQQSAFDKADRYCPIEKSFWMLKILMDFHKQTVMALEAGITLKKITSLPVVTEIGRMKECPIESAVKQLQDLAERIRVSFNELGIKIGQ